MPGVNSALNQDYFQENATRAWNFYDTLPKWMNSAWNYSLEYY